MTVVLAQASGGLSAFENTTLGSCAIRYVGSPPLATISDICLYVVAPISMTCSSASCWWIHSNRPGAP
jgi:hypothetical protein